MKLTSHYIIISYNVFYTVLVMQGLSVKISHNIILSKKIYWNIDDCYKNIIFC